MSISELFAVLAYGHFFGTPCIWVGQNFVSASGNRSCRSYCFLFKVLPCLELLMQTFSWNCLVFCDFWVVIGHKENALIFATKYIICYVYYYVYHAKKLFCEFRNLYIIYIFALSRSPIYVLTPPRTVNYP